jgi:hypothetical protein
MEFGILQSVEIIISQARRELLELDEESLDLVGVKIPSTVSA